MKKILFSAQIVIFAAALPLYGYLEMNRAASTTATSNPPVQTYEVAKTATTAPSVDYKVKFSGKVSKTNVKPVKQSTATIAKTETIKPAVQDNQTSDADIETEQSVFPQSHEWRAISASLTNLDESELTAKIMQELKAAFGKEFHTAMQKMTIKKLHCENKKEICTCISL